MKGVRENTTAEVAVKNKILQARARLLAEPIKLDVENGLVMDGMGFFLADELYLIDMGFLVEVVHIHELTPLPCCPPFILGIINVRGRILSVISLKSFLELPDKGITNHNQVLIVRLGSIEVGILVDEVAGKMPVFTDHLLPALATLTAKQKEYLLGVTKSGAVVLDLQKFLSDDNIIVNEEV